MKKEDLKAIQRHLLSYMVYLKSKSLSETNPEELVEFEVEIEEGYNKDKGIIECDNEVIKEIEQILKR